MAPCMTLKLEIINGTKIVQVDKTPFTIGRSPQSDLTIENTRLSRNHAVIYIDEGLFRISDCGSTNGTFLNGRRVEGSSRLSNDDLILLAEAIELKVVLADMEMDLLPFIEETEKAVEPVQKEYPKTYKRQIDLKIITGAIALIIVILPALLISFTKREGAKPSLRPQQRLITPESRTEPAEIKNKINASDQIEMAAIRFMARISRDASSYNFPEEVLNDIEERVKQYSSDRGLQHTLVEFQKRSHAIAMESRQIGIDPPGLVIYSLLAQLYTNRQPKDPIETARGMLPILNSLRGHFGEDPDSTLLIVAALPEGPGSKKSHPLLNRMQGLRNPLAHRNVWYLRKVGKIDNGSYDLVLKFISLGIIAQNPTLVNFPLEPLPY
jgi:pSer/pThr/pTyr-binding forkhead associated (FHA) protein